MSDTSEDAHEVSIIRKSTTMTSEEYFSIQLKSPTESVESLLQKAILATNSAQPKAKEPQIVRY